MFFSLEAAGEYVARRLKKSIDPDQKYALNANPLWYGLQKPNTCGRKAVAELTQQSSLPPTETRRKASLLAWRGALPIAGLTLNPTDYPTQGEDDARP
jgi:hypothetical protein